MSQMLQSVSRGQAYLAIRRHLGERNQVFYRFRRRLEHVKLLHGNHKQNWPVFVCAFNHEKISVELVYLLGIKSSPEATL